MAQAFGHLILPLCNERDLRTQIRWGLADFRHRFGRDADGMWLPEAAVNDDVLAVLAEEGVGFTILAPGQAELPEGSGPLDTSKPYRWCHPTRSGLGVDIVFYDGGLSHDLAFSLSALSSEAFVERVEGAAARGGLVTVATDGETFGHHHSFGDRLLAYALAVEAPRRGIEGTNVGPPRVARRGAGRAPPPRHRGHKCGRVPAGPPAGRRGPGEREQLVVRPR